MRNIAIFGLVLGIAGAAPAERSTDSANASSHTASTVAAPAEPAHPADPYAALLHCKEEVRAYMSVSTETHARRLKALEDCVAAAKQGSRVEVAGP